MLYLMIENPGVSPVEGYLFLGVSTTRFADNDRTIGTFGSGAKHAVNVCLRNHLTPIVCCGPLRLSFFSKPLAVNDGLTAHEYGQVCCKLKGVDPAGKSCDRTEDLGFVLEHGTQDWGDDLNLALREFVANAIDRTIRETGDFKQVRVEVVDEGKVRVRAGHTRVFVPLVPAVQQFYNELPRRFLHFGEPHLLDQRILPKGGRNVTPGRQTAVIYKQGVFVREVDSTDVPSLFDYNFCGDELKLDESRKVDDCAVKSAATKALRDSDPTYLTQVFRALISVEHKALWEMSFDAWLLRPQWSDAKEAVEARKKKWRGAWAVAAGDQAVACTAVAGVPDAVARKGYRPSVLPADAAAWLGPLGSYDVPVDHSVLTADEMVGRELFEPTEDAIAALDRVWGWLESVSMTQGKARPLIQCFRTVMDAGNLLLGYYRDGVVYINSEIAIGQSDILLQTTLEEAAHYVTGATDNSRDFQNFAFQFAVAMALRGFNAEFTPELETILKRTIDKTPCRRPDQHCRALSRAV